MKSWEKLTNNKKIVSWIKGYPIKFLTKPLQRHTPPVKSWSQSECKIIQPAIGKLLVIGAISKCTPCSNQFVSSIFVRPKKDGSYRMILNLKNLNKYINPPHFKMENHKTACKLISANCYLATLDLKDAYLLVPVKSPYRKYLRFVFNGVMYEYNSLPFGLNVAPFVFTKILKPLTTMLRSRGIKIVVYLDDFLIIGNTYEDCIDNIRFTCLALQDLGFLINWEKSQLVPQHTCAFLGFVFNSSNMTISLPESKKQCTIALISKFKVNQQYTIHQIAQLIGVLVSICPAVRYGWLHTKDLEMFKTRMLSQNRKNFKAKICLPSHLFEHLRWWLKNIPTAHNELKTDQFDHTIYSDASKEGWGAVWNGEVAKGRWSTTERQNHINYLELLAAFFGLKTFAKHFNGVRILCKIDNTTAIAYINKMGGTRYAYLNNVTKEIWDWCESKNIFIHASYIKSSLNVDADTASREGPVETEWELNQSLFQSIIDRFESPDIDLFASRINRKCEKFVSWRNDPESCAIDAFTLNWADWYFYAFPPFSLILRAIRKIINDKAEGIMVVPLWPSQPWYPLFTSILTSPPLVFGPQKLMLFSADRLPHPLCHQLTLVVGR